MDGLTSGFVGLMMNGGGVNTIDVGDYATSQWNFIQLHWPAPPDLTTTDMVLEWYGPAARLDAITFAPISAYCGAAPPIGIMPDGEFECGMGGWTQQVPDTTCTAGVALTDGYTNIYGQHAWWASTPGPDPAQQQSGVSARLVSPAVPVTPGKSYMVAYTVYFNAYNVGFLGITINGAPVATRHPNDREQGTGWFASAQCFWVAPPGVTTATVAFEAAFAAAGGLMGVDGVIFVEAAQN
jgi:hypothetical protein